MRCVHCRSERSYCAPSKRRTVRRSRRQAFNPSSQPCWSEGEVGPEKNTSLGGGSSVRFITPVWETRSWRGFHSSAEEEAQIRSDALTKTRTQRENSFRFMNEPQTALWLETMRTNSRATIEGMSTGEGIEEHRYCSVRRRSTFV